MRLEFQLIIKGFPTLESEGKKLHSQSLLHNTMEKNPQYFSLCSLQLNDPDSKPFHGVALFPRLY